MIYYRTSNKNFMRFIIALMILGLFFGSANAISIEEIEEAERTNSIGSLENNLKGSIHVEAPRALLMSSDGNIIYSKSATFKQNPASLTKIITAILVVEKLDLDKKITVSPEAVGITGNTMELKKGERLTVRELLNALLVYSANDAAIALAIETEGNVEAFVEKMNKKAKTIGCKNTNFISPNGLTNDVGHYSTPYDVAIMSKELLKHKELRDIVKKKSIVISATNRSPERKYKNTNKLLGKYKPCIGVKTGFMRTSGNCLSAATKAGDGYFIAVAMGSPYAETRFNDCETMLKYANANYKVINPYRKGDFVGRVDIARSSRIAYGVKAKGNMSLLIPRDTEDDAIEFKRVCYPNLKAPMKKNRVVGYIKAMDAGKELARVYLVVPVDVKKGGPWTVMGITDWMMYLLFAFLFIIILMLVIINRKKKKRRILREKFLREKRARELELQRQREEYKRRRNWPY